MLLKEGKRSPNQVLTHAARAARSKGPDQVDGRRTSTILCSRSRCGAREALTVGYQPTTGQGKGNIDRSRACTARERLYLTDDIRLPRWERSVSFEASRARVGYHRDKKPQALNRALQVSSFMIRRL